MKINDRLKQIGDLVDTNSLVLDIGCDHALLDVYLIKENIASFAVAADISLGPLNSAKKNIEQYKLTDKIITRLGNGLDTYTEDLDTVIISGLGGKSMVGIFNRNLKKLKTINNIIISPNNYQSEVKRFLIKHGYMIEEEKLVKERHIVYQIIKFEKGKKKYTKKELFFGPILLKEKSILFKDFYQRELKSREILLALIPKKFYKKRYITKKEIKILKEEL